MDSKIEWMNILMALGAGFGGLLSIILLAVTDNDSSLFLFVIGLFGGAFLGWFIEKFISKDKNMPKGSA